MNIELNHIEKNANAIGRLLSKAWSPGSMIMRKPMQAAAGRAAARRGAREALIGSTMKARQARALAKNKVQHVASDLASAQSRLSKLQKPGFLERVSGGRWGAANRQTKMNIVQGNVKRLTNQQTKVQAGLQSANRKAGQQIGAARRKYKEAVSNIGPGSSMAQLQKRQRMIDTGARAGIVAVPALAVASQLNPGQQQSQYYYR